VSLFYSRSENFQPKSGRIDPFGAPLPPPLGKTKDYGVRLSLLGGRLSAKINWYDTTVANDTLPEFGTFYWLSATEAWGYQFARQALADGGNGALTFAGGYTPVLGQTAAEAKADGIAIASAYLNPVNQPADSFYQLYGIDRSQWSGNISFTDPARLGVTVTGSTRSQGTEYEFTAQPLPNWNITFNFSQTQAQSHGLADSLAAWIEQRWAVFNTPVSGTSRPAVIGDLRMWWNDPSTQTVRQAFHDNVWIPYRLYRAKENSDVSELRPRRFNLVTDYTFRTGRLEGTKVGGACRWQDRVVLGYPVLPDATETSAQPFDLSHPYLGSNETAVDLWIGYERKLSPKIHWRCQLNVSNAFAKSGLIPISVQPDGSMAAGRIAEPRTWTVTNSISF
jgi:outer membrane receptor for ferric coprogen and ferric-rhodotorulic acid